MISTRTSATTNALCYLSRQRGSPCLAVAGLHFSSYAPRKQYRKSRRRINRRPGENSRSIVAFSDDDVPSLSLAKSMPLSMRVMDNTSLTALGASGNHKALEEMLKRHIMATHDIGYNEASDIYTLIEKKNHEWEKIMAFPFQSAILMCFTAGCISIPLVFHLPTVELFNEHFVTAEHPPIKELETSLETASWSWNWMEPVLGTSTFLLLCLQYMRMHLRHLGVNPYTVRMKRIRGRHLADAFPQYNEELLIAYSEAAPFYNAKDLWF